MTGWGFSGSYTSCYISFFFFFSKGNHYKLLHYCLLSKRFSPPAWHPIPLLCSLFCLNLPVNMLKPFSVFFWVFPFLSISFLSGPLPLIFNAVNNILPSHQRPKLREYLLFLLLSYNTFLLLAFFSFPFLILLEVKGVRGFFFINGWSDWGKSTELSWRGVGSPFNS